MCDVDPNDPVCLVDTIPSSSGTDATACRPANGMTNLNTDAILEGNRLMVLHSILDSVTVVEQEWPRSAFPSVQKRFDRMSRNGWLATLRYYNEKFGCTLDIDAFKKLAQSEMGMEVISDKNGERRRIATCLTEPCILTDTTEYINLRDKFLSKIKEISMKEIGKVVVRTRKHPNELVDSKVLDLINRVVGEYAGPRSAWKESIESKISKLVLSKDLLEKARKQEKLSTSETKRLKKIMREFNLNLSSVTDLSEALVKKN
ncbi:hypothetical protein CWI36_2276p0010 [Hamiltosporidium magnivora]|uniref:Uncharacterized protein n=1 Tax=Hamiltosporidium magnivora TaxID=148818 RepID=A0A4Q9KV11_9MICR|nr:hypothetical protein CWI36_2276p0010 [Hamiltosporidium magnivora]